MLPKIPTQPEAAARGSVAYQRAYGGEERSQK
jgi:hypothetical protein